MTDGQFFSHTTAAHLHRLRMPEGFREKALHVTSMAPMRAPRAAGVIGHKTNIASTAWVDGLRVQAAVEAWCELGGILSLDDLVVMGDGLVSRNKPVATIDQLRAAVARHSGRGCRVLREASGLVRSGTDSARETMLRLIAVRAGFPEPQVNHRILNEYGAAIAHGDLVFVEYRTILEYEGEHHGVDARQFAIDIRRLDELMEEGWRVIRVDKQLMAHRATLLGKVERALREHGWARSPAPR